MTTRQKILLTTVAAIASATPATSAEWPHLMGPRYDRTSLEEIEAPWAPGQARRIWEMSCDGGFSSFVTGDGRAYTVVSRRKGFRRREVVVALDLTDGREIWAVPLGPASYDRGGKRGASGNSGGDGPRATPVFHEGRVFVFGGRFDLHALEASSGRVMWSRDLIKEFDGETIRWSNTAAPLIAGDRVLVAGGGRGRCFLAFRASDGEVLWKRGEDRVSHATPILATIHGREQALFIVGRGVVAVDPVDGRELWHYPFTWRTSIGASPVVWRNIVHCTAGYGVGGAACEITRDGETWEVRELWRNRGNRDTASHWSTAVAHDGYLYGTYGYGEYGSAAFKCIDIRTGEVAWEADGFGHGAVIRVGQHLLAMTDFGRLSLIAPDPSAYREIGRLDALEGKCWSTPAFSDGRLLLRSTTQGVCLML